MGVKTFMYNIMDRASTGGEKVTSLHGAILGSSPQQCCRALAPPLISLGFLGMDNVKQMSHTEWVSVLTESPSNCQDDSSGATSEEPSSELMGAALVYMSTHLPDARRKKVKLKSTVCTPLLVSPATSTG